MSAKREATAETVHLDVGTTPSWAGGSSDGFKTALSLARVLSFLMLGFKIIFLFLAPLNKLTLATECDHHKVSYMYSYQ